jgi:small nuclear ribonucleoprotein G
MEKKLMLQLNGNRSVTGILRGFDPFLNVVLDEANEVTKKQEKIPIGTVVRSE